MKKTFRIIILIIAFPGFVFAQSKFCCKFKDQVIAGPETDMDKTEFIADQIEKGGTQFFPLQSMK